MIILALDALDLEMIRKFHCTNLMQKECGQTDISDFKEPRTIVLWASFLSGKNMEARIPLKTQWEFTLDVRDTFLELFSQHRAIDVPSFSYKQQNHAEERKLLKGYFDDKATVEEFDALVWRYHRENRKEFLDAVGTFDLLIGYFDLADAIGHLSFGVAEKMSAVYQELEDLAKEVKGSDDFILVISDHGMKAVGRYGDHTKRGFYSINHKLGLHLPKITDFYNIMRSKA
jgi:hypothetical protein